MSVKKAFLGLSLCFFLFFCQGRLFGTVYHVSVHGSPGNDGLSWSTAMSSLQHALDQSSSGDQIWLQGGTYSPEKDHLLPDSGHYGRSYLLKDGVSLLGGFKGTEKSSDERQRRDLDGNGQTEAWEYSAESILEGKPGLPGTLVVTGAIPFAQPTLLDGLTLRNGDSTGLQTLSQGGGGWLNGTITLENCRILHNTAQHGGGLYLVNDVTVRRCLIADNRLDNSCDNSCGGGIYLEGSGCQITYCVIKGNKGAVLGGGGIYCHGTNLIAHCVFAANESLRYGSAVRFSENPSRLLNSLFWENLPKATQIYPGGASVQNNAATQFIPGNLCLQSANAGPDGIHCSNSSPDCFYACLLSPETGNFSPGEGSALINRGLPLEDIPGTAPDALLRPACQFQHPDIGCFESPFPGNLILDFYLSSPLYYGSTSTLTTIMPEEQQKICSFVPAPDSRLKRLRSSRSEGRITASGTGEQNISGELQLSPDESGNWNSLRMKKSYRIAKRKIFLRGHALKWEEGAFPRLTWEFVQGELLNQDRITGEPALLEDPVSPGTYAYGIGSLAISPESSREFYELEFQEGTVECLPGGTADIRFDNLELTYNGKRQAPEFQTLPANLPASTIFRGVPEERYPASPLPPVNAGSYSMTVTVTESYCTGTRTEPFTIKPAILTCTATDAEMHCGDELPEFSIRYEGFQGNDNADSIIPPEVTTTATVGSAPSEEGYPLELSGGQAENYTLVRRPGVLTVSRILPKINESLAGICTYGTPMKHILLMAFASDPQTGEYISGEFVWDAPEEISPAGDWEYSWTFIPDNRDRYESVAGTTQVYVAPREIAVAAFPLNKIYGENDPELRFEITAGSLARGDRFSQLLIRIPGEIPGDYSILLNNPGQYPNYKITYLQNFLTIQPRKITLQAVDSEKFYHEPDPEFTYVISKGSLAFNDQINGVLRRMPGENPGRYVIGQGTLALPAHYELQFLNGTLTIRSPELFTDGPLPEFTLTYGQLPEEAALDFPVKRNDTGETVQGSLQWQNPHTRLSPGSHELQWIFKPRETEIFQNLTGNCRITVHPAPLQIQFSGTYSREFNADNPVFSYQILGFQYEDNETSLAETPRISCDCRPDSPPGIYKVRTTGGSDPRYTFLHHQTTLEITRGTPRSNTSSGQPDLMIVNQDTGEKKPILTYGQPLGKLELRSIFYSGTVPPSPIDGRLSWQRPEEILPAGSAIRSWSFVPDSPHYCTITGKQEITVRKKDLKVLVEDAAIEIGMPLPAFTPVYEGFVNQEHPGVLRRQPVIQCEAADSSRAGEFKIIYSGAESGNYNFLYQRGTLAITAIALLPDDNVPEFHFPYGTAPEKMNYRSTAVRKRDGAKIPGTYRWRLPSQMPDAGLHHLNWEFIADSQPEQYQPLTGNHAVIIEPLPVTVIADPQKQIYGEQEKTLTYTVPKGENLPENFFSGNLTRAPGQDAGNYAISQGSLSCLPNYQIQFTPAIYSIAPKILNVTISPDSKEYGSQDPPFVYQTEFAQDRAHLSGTIRRTPGENAGVYEFSAENLQHSGNYHPVLVNTIFTIRPRNVTIAGDKLQKFYGTEDPELTWTVSSGSILPDDSPSGLPVRATGEQPGSYAVSRGSLKLSDNYNLTYLDGEITIRPAPLAPSRPTSILNAVYGRTLTPDLLNFQVLNAVTDKPAAGALVWNHPAERLQPGNQRYTWKFIPEQPGLYEPLGGEIEIRTAKAKLKIRMQDRYEKKYLEPNPEFSFTLEGFVFEDQQNSLQQLPEIQCPADLRSEPGQYKVASTGGLDSRYEFLHGESELVIKAGSLKPAEDGSLPPLQLTHSQSGEHRPALNYGEPLKTLELEGNFFNSAVPPEKISGKTIWKEPDQIPPAGSSSHQWTFMPDDPKYEKLTGEESLMIAKAELIISAGSRSLEVDEPLPLIQPEYRGFVNGENSSVLEQPPILAEEQIDLTVPGECPLTFTGASARNYSIRYSPGILTVRPIALLPENNPPELSIVYGPRLSELNWQGHAIRQRDQRRIAGQYQWRSQQLRPDTGSKAYDWNFIPDQNPEKYALLTGQRNIRTTARSIHVRALPQNQIYGQPEKTLEYAADTAEPLPPGFFTGMPQRSPGQDAGTYEINQGSLQCPPGYEIIFTPADYVISPCPVSVTILPESKAYGDPEPHFQFLADPSSDQMLISGEISRTAGEVPGAYSFSVKGLQAGKNYSLTLKTRIFTVTPRAIAVTADSQQKFYEAPDPDLTWKITSGDLLPEDRPSGKLTRASGELPGQYKIDRGSLSFPRHYAVTFTPGSLAIRPAPLSLHPQPLPLAAVYGDLLHNGLLAHEVRNAVTGTRVAGVLRWHEPDTRLLPGTAHHSWRFIADAPHLYQQLGGSLQVNTAKAKLLFSLPPGYSRSYLEQNPEFTMTVSGFKFQDSQESLEKQPVVQCEADRLSPPGRYPVTIAGGEDSRYEFVYEDSILEIRPEQLQENPENRVVLVHGESEAMDGFLKYGEPLSMLQPVGFFYTGDNPPVRIEGALQWKTPNALYNVGTYRPQWEFIPNSDNYQPLSGTSEITVKPAPLNISVPDYTIDINEPLPVFKAVYSGFVNGENETVLLTPLRISCETQTSATPGEYQIRPEEATARNYSISFRNGTLKISPHKVVLAENQLPLRMNYSQLLSQAGKKLVVNSELEQRPVPGSIRWVTDSDTLPVGNHTLEAIFTPSDTGKYAVTSFRIPIVMEKYTMRIQPDSVTQIYGDQEAAITFSFPSPGDPPAHISVSGAPGRAPGSGVGVYEVTAGTLSAGDNVQLDLLPATYAILKRKLKIQLPKYEKTYGDPDPEFDFTLSEQPIGNDVITGSLTRAPGENAGTYRLSFKDTPTNNNYDIDAEQGSGFLKINPRPLTIRIDAKAKTFGDPDPALTWTLQEEEFLQTAGIVMELQRSPGEDCGSYEISPRKAVCGGNFKLNIINSSLAIGKMPIIIEVTPKEKYFSQPDPSWQCRPAPGISQPSCSIQGRVKRAPGEEPGKYPFLPESLNLGRNYQASFTEGFAIRPLTVKIQICNTEKPLGDLDPVFDWAILTPGISKEMFQGEIQINRAPGEKRGYYALTGQLIRCHRNYTAQIVPGKLLIKEPAVVFRNITASRITYGEPLRNSQIQGEMIYSDGQIPQTGTFQWEFPDVMLRTGTYTANWTCHIDQYPDQIFSGQADVTVIPKTIPVRALDTGKLLHGEEPVLYYEFSNGDLVNMRPPISGNLIRTRGEQPGTYQIQRGTLSFGPDYKLDFQEGTFHIYCRGLTVNPLWEGLYAEGEKFNWEGLDYTYLVDAVATLDEAMLYCQPGGVITLCSGYYYRSNHDNSNKNLIIQGEAANEVVITTPLRLGGPETDKIILKNLVIDTGDDQDHPAETAALTLAEGTSTVTMNQVFLRGGGKDAMHLRGAARVQAENCSFQSESGTAVQILEGSRPRLNHHIRFENCSFYTSRDDQYYVQLHDDEINPENNGVLPLINCCFNGKEITRQSDSQMSEAVKQQMLDADSPVPSCRSRVMLKEELRECFFTEVSPLEEQNLVVTLANPPENFADYSFMLRLIDSNGQEATSRKFVPRSRYESAVLPVKQLPVGKYELRIEQLTPAEEGIHRIIAGKSEYFHRVPPEQLTSLSISRIPPSTDSLKVGDVFRYQVTAHYQNLSWDVTAQALVSYRPEEFLEIVRPDGLHLCSKVAGTHEIKAEYKNEKATMKVTYLADATVWFRDPRPAEHLLMGEYHYYDYNFHDKFGNLTTEKISSIECPDKEYLHPFKNALLLDIDVPFNKTDLTLVSNRGTRIPLTQRIVSPGNDWCLDWALAPNFTTIDALWGCYFVFIDPQNIIQKKRYDRDNLNIFLFGREYEVAEHTTYNGSTNDYTYDFVLEKKGSRASLSGEHAFQTQNLLKDTNYRNPSPDHFRYNNRNVYFSPEDPLNIIANITDGRYRWFFIRNSKLMEYQKAIFSR